MTEWQYGVRHNFAGHHTVYRYDSRIEAIRWSKVGHIDSVLSKEVVRREFLHVEVWTGEKVYTQWTTLI